MGDVFVGGRFDTNKQQQINNLLPLDTFALVPFLWVARSPHWKSIISNEIAPQSFCPRVSCRNALQWMNSMCDAMHAIASVTQWVPA